MTGTTPEQNNANKGGGEVAWRVGNSRALGAANPATAIHRGESTMLRSGRNWYVRFLCVCNEGREQSR